MGHISYFMLKIIAKREIRNDNGLTNKYMLILRYGFSQSILYQ